MVINALKPKTGSAAKNYLTSTDFSDFGDDQLWEIIHKQAQTINDLTNELHVKTARNQKSLEAAISSLAIQTTSDANRLVYMIQKIEEAKTVSTEVERAIVPHILVQKISIFFLIFFLFSLMLSIVGLINLVHPFLSLVGVCATILFYFMGVAGKNIHDDNL